MKTNYWTTCVHKCDNTAVVVLHQFPEYVTVCLLPTGRKQKVGIGLFSRPNSTKIKQRNHRCYQNVVFMCLQMSQSAQLPLHSLCLRGLRTKAFDLIVFLFPVSQNELSSVPCHVKIEVWGLQTRVADYWWLHSTYFFRFNIAKQFEIIVDDMFI